MNFLLDTSTILWLQVEPSRVPAPLRQILLMPETLEHILILATPDPLSCQYAVRTMWDCRSACRADRQKPDRRRGRVVD
jgi:hypothetical protein